MFLVPASVFVAGYVIKSLPEKYRKLQKCTWDTEKWVKALLPSLPQQNVSPRAFMSRLLREEHRAALRLKQQSAETTSKSLHGEETLEIGAFVGQIDCVSWTTRRRLSGKKRLFLKIWTFFWDVWFYNPIFFIYFFPRILTLTSLLIFHSWFQVKTQNYLSFPGLFLWWRLEPVKTQLWKQLSRWNFLKTDSIALKTRKTKLSGKTGERKTYFFHRLSNKAAVAPW